MSGVAGGWRRLALAVLWTRPINRGSRNERTTARDEWAAAAPLPARGVGLAPFLGTARGGIAIAAHGSTNLAAADRGWRVRLSGAAPSAAWRYALFGYRDLENAEEALLKRGVDPDGANDAGDDTLTKFGTGVHRTFAKGWNDTWHA